MSSAKVLLRKYHKKKDGTYPIVIRLYDNARCKFVYSGYSVQEDHFQDVKGNWVKRHPDAALINNKLLAMLQETDPEDAIKGKRVTDYLEAKAKEYDSLNQPDTARKLRRHVVEIEEMGDKEIIFSKLTPNWVTRYRVHLVKEYGNGNNTIMHKIAILRRIYRKAVKDGWAKGPNPFEDLGLRLTPVDRQKLTINEIRKIEELPLKAGSILDQSRDAFIFAFYAHGMRFQNIFELTWKSIDGDVLRYRMNKGKKFREIRLHEKAVAILEKYKGGKWVFPFAKKQWKDQKELGQMKGSANALVNAALKTVAELAEVHKDISMHIARHSFAYLLKKKGVNQHVIKDALGHTKMITTDIYLKSLDDDLVNKTVLDAFS